MVLMKFKESQAANIYFEQYNNRLFSSMEVSILIIHHKQSGPNLYFIVSLRHAKFFMWNQLIQIKIQNHCLY